MEPPVKRMRVAYLTTQYPAVSHSFIRREIAAVEKAGMPVSRYSVRRAPADLPDPRDRAELERTQFILAQGGLRLGLALLSQMARSPARFASALRCTLGMARKSERGYVAHLAYLAEAAWLTPRLMADGITHLHVHFGTNATAVARLAHRLGGPAYSFTVHGPDEFDGPRALDLGGKIAEAQACVAISSFGRSQLMRWSDPAHWPRILVARCGVDESFRTETAPVPAPAAPRLCCVARLSAQKGLPLLIAAAAQVRDAGHAFHLTLVGDGEMRAEIEQQIARLGLSGAISITGWASSDRVREEILASRAMILPSFAEGLPVVIMEALALRRPVIASRIAGTPELVDEQCGWLIPAGDVDAISRAIIAALAAEPETLDRMGEEGRRRVLASHDADRNGADLLAQLRQLSGNGHEAA